MYSRIKNEEFNGSCAASANNLLVKPFCKMDPILVSLEIDTLNVMSFAFTDQLKINTVFKINVLPLVQCEKVIQFCINEASFLDFNSICLFAVISTNGIHLYDDQLSKCILMNSTSEIMEKCKEKKSSQVSLGGICSLDDFLFLGTSFGAVFIFELNCRPKIAKISMQWKETIRQHCAPISYITSQMLEQNKSICVCDLQGNVTVWQLLGSQINLLVRFAGFNNFPCIATRFYKQMLICAYTSGHLRVYDMKEKYLLCEVSAHARSISAIDICPLKGLLLSVSEDTFLRVWQLAPNNGEAICHLFCESLEDRLLMGGAFLNSDGDYIGITAYDEKELILFHRDN